MGFRDILQRNTIIYYQADFERFNATVKDRKTYLNLLLVQIKRITYEIDGETDSCIIVDHAPLGGFWVKRKESDFAVMNKAFLDYCIKHPFYYLLYSGRYVLKLLSVVPVFWFLFNWGRILNAGLDITDNQFYLFWLLAFACYVVNVNLNKL